MPWLSDSVMIEQALPAIQLLKIHRYQRMTELAQQSKEVVGQGAHDVVKSSSDKLSDRRADHPLSLVRR